MNGCICMYFNHNQTVTEQISNNRNGTVAEQISKIGSVFVQDWFGHEQIILVQDWFRCRTVPAGIDILTRLRVLIKDKPRIYSEFTE